jgi:hypothetical protein
MTKLAAVLAVAALTIVVVALVGCGGTSNDPSMQGNRLVGTAWDLSLVQLPNRERLPVQQPGDYRIAWVEENRFVVQVLRNKCVGNYNSSGRALAVQLDCPAGSLPPGSIGREFLAILSTATHFGMTSSGGEMFIDSSTSGGSLSFRRLSNEQIEQILQENQQNQGG